MSGTRNYYAILELPFTATHEEITKAYHKLAMKFHPDKNPNNSKAQEIFAELSNAYETLHDPEKKTAYDFLTHEYPTFQAGASSAAQEGMFAHHGDATSPPKSAPTAQEQVVFSANSNRCEYLNITPGVKSASESYPRYKYNVKDFSIDQANPDFPGEFYITIFTKNADDYQFALADRDLPFAPHMTGIESTLNDTFNARKSHIDFITERPEPLNYDRREQRHCFSCPRTAVNLVKLFEIFSIPENIQQDIFRFYKLQDGYFLIMLNKLHTLQGDDFAKTLKTLYGFIDSSITTKDYGAIESVLRALLQPGVVDRDPEKVNLLCEKIIAHFINLGTQIPNFSKSADLMVQTLDKYMAAQGNVTNPRTGRAKYFQLHLLLESSADRTKSLTPVMQNKLDTLFNEFMHYEPGTVKDVRFNVGTMLQLTKGSFNTYANLLALEDSASASSASHRESNARQ